MIYDVVCCDMLRAIELILDEALQQEDAVY